MVHKEKRSNPDSGFVVTEPGGLLAVLLLKYPERSRSKIKSLLTHGGVTVDGRVVTKHDHPLLPGQHVQIAKPVQRSRQPSCKLEILYEDRDLIVINKPAGLLSIGTDRERERTAYHILTEYVQQLRPTNRIFVVHRLDRDTSGVLIVAKNEKIKLALQDNWAELTSERGYVAVVEGTLVEKQGTIRSWLKQTDSFLVYSGSREGDGQEAITHYEVLNESETYSLLRVKLETGRKNQIRVHMKDIGHPVAGDPKYGAKTDPLKRLGLHADRLELRHPFTGQKMMFEAAAPKSFLSLFGRRHE